MEWTDSFSNRLDERKICIQSRSNRFVERHGSYKSKVTVAQKAKKVKELKRGRGEREKEREGGRERKREREGEVADRHQWRE